MPERFHLAVVSVTDGCTIVDKLSLVGAFPWAAHLDDKDQQKMLEALAGRSNWTAEEVRHELHAWQRTAEVLADPEVREVLLNGTIEEGDFVEAPRPGEYVFDGVITERIADGTTTVVVPFSRPDGDTEGEILFDLDEARVLRDMLTGALEENEASRKRIEAMTAPLTEAEIEGLNKALASGGYAGDRRVPATEPGPGLQEAIRVLARHGYTATKPEITPEMAKAREDLAQRIDEIKRFGGNSREEIEAIAEVCADFNHDDAPRSIRNLFNLFEDRIDKL